MPWRNGGGVTRDVALSPPGAGFAFDWRVSIAQVERGGPFSCFEGVDRTLAVLSGAMQVTLEGRAPLTLDEQSEPMVFAGEAPCSAQPTRSVTDLNVMVRRGLYASVARRADEVLVAGPGTQIFVATRPCVLGGERLGRLDAVRVDEGEGQALPLVGHGWWICLPGPEPRADPADATQDGADRP